MCSEVFKRDKEGYIKGFPNGCDDCESETEWDCCHVNTRGEEIICPWRVNYWKYDEIKRLLLFAKAAKGGFDLNRIESINVYDFVKMAILKEYL